MRIGSENSVYSLFRPSTRAATVADEKIDLTPSEAAPASQGKSDGELLADLYDRTAQQMLDFSDIDGDGQMSKDEYFAAQKRLADADKRMFDPDAAEQRWSTLDPEGKGAIGKDEIIEGLKILLPLKVGHLDADAVKRITAQAQEAAKQTMQHFQDAVEDAGRNSSAIQTFARTFTPQASLLALYDEAE